MAEPSYSKRVIVTSNGCLSSIFIFLLVNSIFLTVVSLIVSLFPSLTDTEVTPGSIIGSIIVTLLLASLSWLWLCGLRYVRKSNRKDLEKYRMLRDTVIPQNITRKHMMRSREYFLSANGIVDKLITLGEGLSGIPAFMELFDRANASACLPPQTSGRDAVLYKLRTDLVRCYIGLGHEPDLHKSESLPLALFVLKSRQPAPKITASNYKKVLNTQRKDLEISLRPSIDEARTASDFLFIHWLRQLDNELCGNYRVQLYRFASLVAKADRTISPEETAWLRYLNELNNNDYAISPISAPGSSVKYEIGGTDEKAIQQLEKLVGLSTVKSEISALANYIQVQKQRKEQGLKVSPVSYHCVFTGNPGTGKTTVARIVASIYRELGVLQKGHLVETDRSGLIAEYVGHTAIKTNKLIDSALDGILFIDEAYSLVDGGSCDYGKEAIATLLKRMEDNRDRLVVIIAGYTEDMKRFIHSNPGLESRFNRYIEFPDYSAEELAQIFKAQATRYEYRLDAGAEATLTEILQTAVANKSEHFGNGRFARNLFEKAIACQANRVAALPDASTETLTYILAEDLRAAVK